MVNIGGSWLDEFERIALDKGWIVDKSNPVKDGLIRDAQETLNSVIDMFSGYAPIKKVEVDGKLAPSFVAALDAVRNEVGKPEFAELYSDAGYMYHEARNRLTASDGLGVLSEMFSKFGTPAKRYVALQTGTIKTAITKSDMAFEPMEVNRSKTTMQRGVDSPEMQQAFRGWLENTPEGQAVKKSWSDNYKALAPEGLAMAKQQVEEQRQRDYNRYMKDPVITGTGTMQMPKGGKPRSKSVRAAQKSLIGYYGADAVGKTGADGRWGQATAAAWNRFMKETGSKLGVDPSGKQKPSPGALHAFVQNWVPNAAKAKATKAPQISPRQAPQAKSVSPTGKPVDVTLPTVPGPSSVNTGPRPKEYIPNVDKMSSYRQKAQRVQRDFENDPFFRGRMVDDKEANEMPKGLIKEADAKRWYAGLSGDQQKRVRSYVGSLMEDGMDQAPALDKAMNTMARQFTTPAPTPPAPVATPAWKPKLPSWMNEKEDVLPKGEDILSGVEENMRDKYPSFDLGTGKAVERNTPTMSGPSPVETGDMLKEYIPSFGRVIHTLVSLANDLDSMGSVDASMVVDRHTAMYKEALDKLYDVTGETGEQLIDKAHPGGGPTIAPSKEEGGKVETIVEEHKKVVDKATKKPTGKYAETIVKLVAKANALENSGDVEAAKLIDQAIYELQEASASPFVNRGQALEAAGSEDNKTSIKKEAAGAIANAKSIKKELASHTYKFLLELVKIEHYVDDYGSEPEKMKALIKIVKSKLGAAMRERNETTFPDFAKKAKEAIDLFTNNNIDIKSAFGWADEGEYWPVDKLANRFSNYIDTVLKNQLPAEGSEIRKALYNKYMSVLNTTHKLIAGDPFKSEKAFGNADAAEEVLKAIEEEKISARKYTSNELSGSYRAFNSKLVGHLKRWKYKGAVADRPSLIKVARSLSEILKSLPEPPKTTAPTKGKGRGSKKPPGDDDVQNLQIALNAIGGNGKLKPDGLWGRNTATAYNTLAANAAKRGWGTLPMISNVNRQRHSMRPDSNILSDAISIASKYSRKSSAMMQRLNLDGRTYNMAELGSPKAFLNAMHTNMRYGPGQIVSTEDGVKEIDALISHVSQNEDEFEKSMPGLTQSWKQRLRRLRVALSQYKPKGPQGGYKKDPAGGRWERGSDLINPFPDVPDRDKGTPGSKSPGAAPVAGRKLFNTNYSKPQEVLEAITKIYGKSRIFASANSFRGAYGPGDPIDQLRQVASHLQSLKHALTSNPKGFGGYYDSLLSKVLNVESDVTGLRREM